MKDLLERFTNRYAMSVADIHPNGGFILPDGRLIPAYGNHEAMVQMVGGTLRGLIQAGAVRYHFYRETLGIDFPRSEKLTDSAWRKLMRVVRDHDPYIVMMTQVGRRKAHEVIEPYTNSAGRTKMWVYANGGNIL